MWGAILGILVGIMLGIYALPPILKHYYGEKEVPFGDTWAGGGKTLRIGNTGQAIDPVGPADPGKVRWDYYVLVVITAGEAWQSQVDHWSLEVDGVDDWQVAADASGVEGNSVTVSPGESRELNLHFIIQVPSDFEGQPMPLALHLSDPRLRFDLE